MTDSTKELDRADFGLRLSEPEEEMEVLQRLIGSHHQRVELLLHLVIQAGGRLQGVSAGKANVPHCHFRCN